MKKTHPTQYTIRAVPEHLDNRLREIAVSEGTSLNAAALEALRRGLGEGGGSVRYRTLGGLLDRPRKMDNPGWEKALREMDVVEPDAWR